MCFAEEEIPQTQLARLDLQFFNYRYDRLPSLFMLFGKLGICNRNRWQTFILRDASVSLRSLPCELKEPYLDECDELREGFLAERREFVFNLLRGQCWLHFVTVRGYLPGPSWRVK